MWQKVVSWVLVVLSIVGALLGRVLDVEDISRASAESLWTMAIVCFFIGVPWTILSFQSETSKDLRELQRLITLQSKNLDNLGVDHRGLRQRVEMLASTQSQRVADSLASVQPLKGSLKERAVILSRQLLGFVESTSIAHASPVQFGDQRNEAQRLVDEITEERELALKLQVTYNKEFAARVIDMRNELSAMGLEDKWLDTFYLKPGDRMSMRIIGERIGVLALKIE